MVAPLVAPLVTYGGTMKYITDFPYLFYDLFFGRVVRRVAVIGQGGQGSII